MLFPRALVGRDVLIPRSRQGDTEPTTSTYRTEKGALIKESALTLELNGKRKGSGDQSMLAWSTLVDAMGIDWSFEDEGILMKATSHGR